MDEQNVNMNELTDEQRLENLIDVIGAMVSLDFSQKAIIDDSEGAFNMIAMGLNMLSEELESSVVSKSELEEKNQKLLQLAEEQKMAISLMSTPISKLWEGILLLPLVGMVTTERIKDVLINILESIASTQSKVFILDISGVGIVDTSTANHFIKIAKATRLMGCRSILSGITSETAQTMVELGINIEEIQTTGTMKDAIEKAFSYTGFQLSQTKS